jgi:GxxExxY protein
MAELIFKPESYKIINCCFEVHNELGAGFLEAIYQEALALEFMNQGVPYEQFPEMKVSYKGELLKKKYYPDFLCYDKIILEIKAIETLASDHEAIVLNYIKGTRSPLGLLINFGSQRLQYKRFANTKKKSANIRK